MYGTSSDGRAQLTSSFLRRQGFLGAKVKTWRQIFSFENLSTLTTQTPTAYSAYQTASNSEKLAGLKTRFFPSSAGGAARPTSASGGYADLEKEFAENPRVGKIPFESFGGRAPSAKPTAASAPNGVEGAGFGGFGKQGERKAKLKGYLISKPQVGFTKP